jgi:hypothetical protein
MKQQLLLLPLVFGTLTSLFAQRISFDKGKIEETLVAFKGNVVKEQTGTDLALFFKGQKKAELGKLFNASYIDWSSDKSRRISFAEASLSCQKSSEQKDGYLLDLEPYLDNSKASDTLTLHFRENNKDLGTVVIAKAAPSKKETPPTKEGEAFNYKQYAKENPITLDLPTPQCDDCCSSDLSDPCDLQALSDGMVFNRIVYMADRNLTFYYDVYGKPYMVGITRSKYSKRFKGFKYSYTNSFSKSPGDNIDIRRTIRIPANTPLSFEVVNVNPEAYDIDISDTAIRFNTDVAALFQLPKIIPSIANLSQANEEALADQLKAALVQINDKLKSFFYKLQYSCLNKQNLIIHYKIEARKKIDEFFMENFQKNTAVSYETFFGTMLKDTNDAKALVTDFLLYYNQLSVSYYKKITQVPVVDGTYDKISFIFSIKPKANTPYSTLVKAKPIDAYITGGFKIDISAGLYYGFNMKNEQFSIRADSNIIRNSANTGDSLVRYGVLHEEQNTGKGEFGLASFVHFYPKLSPNVNVSGLIGIGMNIQEKPQVRYFTGLGVLFGRENRIAVNGGLVMGFTNMLSDQYTKNNAGLYDHVSYEEAAKDPVYKKTFSGHFFLSLSYNLPFIKTSGGTQTVAASSDSSSSGSSDKGSGSGSGGGDSSSSSSGSSGDKSGDVGKK